MIALAWLLAVGDAAACGGPDAVSLDQPLLPAGHHLSGWLDGYDGYELNPAPVTRFLYGVHATNPAVYAPLEVFAYGAALGEAPPLAPPSLDAFHAALARGDRPGARDAARAVVAQILDLPSALAEPYAPLLRRPVEYLELEPTLGAVPAADLAAWFAEGEPRAPRKGPLARAAGVRGLPAAQAAAVLARDPANPRAASLRWLALRDAMAKGIPDGWSVEDIQPRVDAATWARLLAETDAWLVAYPGHPLADLVRGKQLRLHYLRGDAAGAWRAALDLYARHPARATGEMRFLLAQGYGPTGVDPAALPPELAAALMPWLAPAPADWTAWWRRTEAEPTAPWALPMQERLLYTLASQEEAALPEGFPAAAAAPSPAWARLRLGLLARAGDADGAWAQSERMATDAEFAGPIRAWVRLTRGDWAGAIREPGVDPAAQRYLVRVLAPEEVLRALLDDPGVGREARLSLALRRRADTGRWDEGVALLTPVDPARAKLWREASKLRDDLAAARYLRDHAGQIFLGRDYDEVVWYRSLPVGPELPRAIGLPFQGADEWAATGAWLQRSFATYAALERYADYLDGVDASRPEATLVAPRKVLDEADEAYNALLNYGSSDGYAWGAVLPDCAPAVTIRRAGKGLRARLP